MREKTLQCNIVSHCLGPYTKWSLEVDAKKQNSFINHNTEIVIEENAFENVFYNVVAILWRP